MNKVLLPNPREVMILGQDAKVYVILVVVFESKLGLGCR